MVDAVEELKKLVQTRTKGKLEPVYVFIKIREAKDVIDLQVKDIDEGLTMIRVHSTNEKYPKWYTHAYLIDVRNLRLNYKEIKKQKQVFEVLTTPNRIVHGPTRQLLNEMEKEYGGILPDGHKKLFFKTSKFKKTKDPFRMRMKAM